MEPEQESKAKKKSKRPQYFELPKTFHNFDKLNLEGFAKRLLDDIDQGIKDNQEVKEENKEGNYLVKQRGEAYTISLDAGFGRGKTTFLEMFENMIKEGGVRKEREGKEKEGGVREEREGKEKEGGVREEREGKEKEGGVREEREGKEKEGGVREEREGKEKEGGVKAKNYSVFKLNVWTTELHDNPTFVMLAEFVNFLEDEKIDLEAKGIDYQELADSAMDIIESAVSLVSEPAGKVIQGGRRFSKEVSKSGKTPLGEQELERYNQQQALVRKIKEVISAYEERTNKKLIILIDELDRVKPDYAVRFLETVKHFFDIPGICFLFAVNRQQVEATVKNLFGGELDFVGYYDKFFKQEFSFVDAYSQGVRGFIEEEIKRFTKKKRKNSIGKKEEEYLRSYFENEMKSFTEKKRRSSIGKKQEEYLRPYFENEMKSFTEKKRRSSIEKKQEEDFMSYFHNNIMKLDRWAVLYQLSGLSLRQVKGWISKTYSSYIELLDPNNVNKSKDMEKFFKFLENFDLTSSKLQSLQSQINSYDEHILGKNNKKEMYDFYLILFYTAFYTIRLEEIYRTSRLFRTENIDRRIYPLIKEFCKRSMFFPDDERTMMLYLYFSFYSEKTLRVKLLQLIRRGLLRSARFDDIALERIIPNPNLLKDLGMEKSKEYPGLLESIFGTGQPRIFQIVCAVLYNHVKNGINFSTVCQIISTPSGYSEEPQPVLMD